ncbi:hypothetical protein GW17_00025059 [Ensete ventricosum]|nr:hypothetical protein GW17_00025059 [Ensete ventricosum]
MTATTTWLKAADEGDPRLWLEVVEVDGSTGLIRDKTATNRGRRGVEGASRATTQLQNVEEVAGYDWSGR